MRAATAEPRSESGERLSDYIPRRLVTDRGTGTNVVFLVGDAQIWRPRHPGTAHEVRDCLARQVDKPILAGARSALWLNRGEQKGRDDDLKCQSADHAAGRHAIHDDAHDATDGEGKVDGERDGKRDGCHCRADDACDHERPKDCQSRAGCAKLVQQVGVLSKRNAVAGLKGVRRQSDECADDQRRDAADPKSDLLKTCKLHVSFSFWFELFRPLWPTCPLRQRFVRIR